MRCVAAGISDARLVAGTGPHGPLSSNPENVRDLGSSHTPSSDRCASASVSVCDMDHRFRPSALFSVRVRCPSVRPSVSSPRNPSSLRRMLHYSSAEFPPPPKVQCGRTRCGRGRRRRLLHFNLSVRSLFFSPRPTDSRNALLAAVFVATEGLFGGRGHRWRRRRRYTEAACHYGWTRSGRA